MLIHYEDGTFVILHLGDLNSPTKNNNVCWYKTDENAPWQRSPYPCAASTKDYLISKKSATDIKFDDAE